MAPVRDQESSATGKLTLEGVGKTFVTARGGTVEALQAIDLAVDEGEVVCLVGPSGCGKSTLLYMIAGLEFPDKGRVLADGAPVTGPGRDRMVMFQESALFPWLDVYDNVLFGLKLKPGLDSKTRCEIADFYLEMVGLQDWKHANVHELSGGMKQRVALARSLAPNPRVLLMDEPFAALDALTRDQLYGDLQRIWAARRKTLVFVTHNVREAVCLGDRVVLFSPHPGRIAEEFRIDLPRPRNVNSAALVDYAARITEALKSHIPANGFGRDGRSRSSGLSLKAWGTQALDFARRMNPRDAFGHADAHADPRGEGPEHGEPWRQEKAPGAGPDAPFRGPPPPGIALHDEDARGPDDAESSEERRKRERRQDGTR
ncbi:MAG TPA: ABC transporter ATP-binding protein [Planctomycetota bacterium]|nr:ABC transporter ATP-binding protein [Planctomycetota bacterium]